MTEPSREHEIALAKERAKRSLPLMAFVLLGLLAISLPLPKRFVAVLPLLVAAYLSVRLLRLVKDRSTSEKLWTALSLGIIVAMLLTLLVQGVFYGPVSAYEQCFDQAQTAAARASCGQLQRSGLLGTLLN